MTVPSFARRPPATAVVGLALAFLATACVTPHTHVRLSPTLEAPASLPGYARIRIIEFPSSADGWMYSYRGAGLRPDVYIHPAPAVAGRGGTARLTRLGSTPLKHSLPARLRQQWIGDYRVRRDEPVVLEIGGRLLEGHRITALIRYPDEEVLTHQYLFVVGSHFIRIRESHTNGTVAEEEVERFARILLTALLETPGAADRSIASPDPVP